MSSSAVRWDLLPSNIVEQVLSHVSLSDLLSCSLVCRKWYNILKDEKCDVWRIHSMNKLSKQILKSEVLSSLSSHKSKLRAYYYAWDSNDCSRNVYIKPNGFTLHRNPVAQSMPSIDTFLLIISIELNYRHRCGQRQNGFHNGSAQLGSLVGGTAWSKSCVSILYVCKMHLVQFIDGSSGGHRNQRGLCPERRLCGAVGLKQRELGLESGGQQFATQRGLSRKLPPSQQRTQISNGRTSSGNTRLR